jgi:hypothetical protein
MTMDEFRASLKAMVSRVGKTKRERPASSEDRETREPVLRVVNVVESLSID